MSKAAAEFVMIPRWLILGSFTADPGASPFLDQGLPREAVLAPSPGEITANEPWRVWANNPVDFLDPALKFKHAEWCFAYAFTYVHVPQAEKVELLAGSDDGIAIWLNTSQVHFNNTFRGVEMDTDRVPVTLQKGWNRLLVKVSQGAQTWGFVLRLRRPAPTGRMTFALSRASTGLAARAQEGTSPLTLTLTRLRVQPGTDRIGLRLVFTAQLFSNTNRAAKNLTLCLADTAGTRYAETALPALGGFQATELALEAEATPIFAALGKRTDLQFVVRSTAGQVTAPLDADMTLRLFLEAMSGFELAPDAQRFAVPAVFRGQPAGLEVCSGHEITMTGQTIAAKPFRATRSYSGRETAAGVLVLEPLEAATVADPVAHLHFGDDKVHDLARRIGFVLDEIRPDTRPALAPAAAGLAALAAADFAGAAHALEAVLAALAGAMPDRSGQKITLVGHAHIDMNWLWTLPETRQVTHDTFRQALAFMEEFPPFCFSQSQASTYELMERLDPALFNKIKERVREGRWELLGGMVDEGDTNLASGEGLARTFLLGQKYFESRFGKTAKVGWLPDNFGHIAQLPQLLRLAGMEFFYGHRCQPKQGPYIWEGIDGSRVQCYITPTYNGEVGPRMRSMVDDSNPGGTSHLWVYGVGDHGGGPTRRDITRALFYDTVPSFPQIHFGTAAAFHEELRTDAARFPVFTGEMQYVFQGCYTSIARIKEGNRRCESALYGAELLAVLATLGGERYPRAALEAAWWKVAFNQFHDILCGSAVHDANREAVAVYDLALTAAQDVQFAALRALAAAMPTREGQGQPVVVFNPQPVPRTDMAEAEIFSYVPPPTARLAGWGGQPHPAGKAQLLRVTPADADHPFATILLTDGDGREIPAQIVDGHGFPHGYRLKVRFLAEQMPPCGCRVFYARPEQGGARPDTALRVTGTTIETPWLKLVVDARSGNITRLYDKRRRKEVLRRGQAGNVLKIYMEKPHAMSAWDLGPVSAVHTLDKVDGVRVTEHGPVRATIEVRRRWNRSIFVQRIHVYRDLPRVEFELEAHWFEQGTPDTDAPMLRVAFPLAVTKGRFVCDTPFAALERPADGREVPAQRWVDLADDTGGAALLNTGKYGHRCAGSTLEMTLLRASYEPDPYPDQGPHCIGYSLLPHAGDWRQAGIAQQGQAFSQPLLALETPPGQKGGKVAAGSGLSLAPNSLLLSGVKQAHDDDATIIRFYEAHGRATPVTLVLPKAAKRVQRVDLLEAPLAGAAPVTVRGATVRLKARAHEVVTLKVVF